MRWSHAVGAATTASFAGGRAVVGLRPGVDPRVLGLRVVRRLRKLRLAIVAGSPRDLAALASRADPRLRYVQPLRSAVPAHVRNDPLSWQIDSHSGAPYEWAFHAVGADAALSLGKGDPSILVGIVDSGVARVRDLRGKIAETFWDPHSNLSAADVLGHGTFVASLIAAPNDDGFGLAGYCGACRVAVYKAIPLDDVEIAAGIERLTDAHVRIINLSLVEPSVSQDIVDAINYAFARGVLVVAASGNEGQGTVDFPASVLQRRTARRRAASQSARPTPAATAPASRTGAVDSRSSPRAVTTDAAASGSSAPSLRSRPTSTTVGRATLPTSTPRATATPTRAERASQRLPSPASRHSCGLRRRT